jgi:hypothetical protein
MQCLKRSILLTSLVCARGREKFKMFWWYLKSYKEFKKKTNNIITKLTLSG